MKNIDSKSNKRLWDKIYKLRKINVALTIYSLVLTIMLIVLFSANAKAEENLEKYNKLPVKVETLEHNIDSTTKEENSEVLQLISNKKSGKTETMTITAYCPCKKCCGKWANGITSTGVKAQAGRTVAVDPRKIPYGTKVIIDGHTYIAEDCGGAIKGNRIDIFFNTHSEALQWGRRTKQVTILN